MTQFVNRDKRKSFLSMKTLTTYILIPLIVFISFGASSYEELNFQNDYKFEIEESKFLSNQIRIWENNEVKLVFDSTSFPESMSEEHIWSVFEDAINELESISNVKISLSKRALGIKGWEKDKNSDIYEKIEVGETAVFFGQLYSDSAGLAGGYGAARDSSGISYIQKSILGLSSKVSWNENSYLYRVFMHELLHNCLH